MIVVKLDDIVHTYATKSVLHGVTWEIRTGQRIGLVGANGAGKSTLLRLITGDADPEPLTPDAGSIYRCKNLQIGYLAQEPHLDPACTVWQEVLNAHDDVRRTEATLRRLEAAMADPQVYDDEARLARTLAAYEHEQAAFERLGGYRHESRARQALQALGFSESDLELPVSALSGGQKKLLGLARLLSKDTNLLLLDEPDNHLDLAAKEGLERLIAGYLGAVVIVSHDRYLLDAVVTDIAEVEDGRVTVFQGTYSAYVLEKQARLLRQQRMYQAQQKEITRIEAAIARFDLWASMVVNERHARQASARRKMLERMDRIEQPVLERRRMSLELTGWRGSQKVLEIEDLDKVFDDEQIVLAGLRLLVWHGERVGLLGANGSGKSVLLRCILGLESPTSGVIKIGPSVRVGYYAQEHETLDPDKAVLDEVRDVKPLTEGQAVSFLGRFLFPYAMVRNPVRALSGGERSRLQLAKLVLSDANLLVLDEPTNNLDLPSCEVLEAALDDFTGTVLVVSHDRYFLDRVVDRIVELDDGVLTEYPGDYAYYAEHRAKRSEG